MGEGEGWISHHTLGYDMVDSSCLGLVKSLGMSDMLERKVAKVEKEFHDMLFELNLDKERSLKLWNLFATYGQLCEQIGYKEGRE
jgi:hypothetical protein